jgi:hypothetical protein
MRVLIAEAGGRPQVKCSTYHTLAEFRTRKSQSLPDAMQLFCEGPFVASVLNELLDCLDRLGLACFETARVMNYQGSVPGLIRDRIPDIVDTSGSTSESFFMVCNVSL